MPSGEGIKKAAQIGGHSGVAGVYTVCFEYGCTLGYLSTVMYVLWGFGGLSLPFWGSGLH